MRGAIVQALWDRRYLRIVAEQDQQPAKGDVALSAPRTHNHNRAELVRELRDLLVGCCPVSHRLSHLVEVVHPGGGDPPPAFYERSEEYHRRSKLLAS